MPSHDGTFASIEDVIERFGHQKYTCNRRIAKVVYLASHLEKPILVEGPAGVGKTELAKVLASALGHELMRLQCYEGLDEGKALYEWEYAKQLLYTQILKDKISEVIGGAKSLTEAVWTARRQPTSLTDSLPDSADRILRGWRPVGGNR